MVASGKLGGFFEIFWGFPGLMAACKRRVEWQNLCRLAPSNLAFSRPGDLLLNKVKRLSRILGGKLNAAEDAAGYVFWRHSLGRAIFGFWGLGDTLPL